MRSGPESVLEPRIVSTSVVIVSCPPGWVALEEEGDMLARPCRWLLSARQRRPQDDDFRACRPWNHDPLPGYEC